MSLERRINSVYIKSGLWLRPMRKKAETPGTARANLVQGSQLPAPTRNPSGKWSDGAYESPTSLRSRVQNFGRGLNNAAKSVIPHTLGGTARHDQGLERLRRLGSSALNDITYGVVGEPSGVPLGVPVNNPYMPDSSISATYRPAGSESSPLMWGIGVGGLAGAKGTIQSVGKAMTTANKYRKAKAEAEAVRDALPALVTQAEKSLAAAEKAYRTSQTEMTLTELTRARSAFNALQERTLAAAEAAGRASVLPSRWENAMNYMAGGASGGMRNGLIWGSGAAGAAQLYNWANPKPEYVEQWDTSGDPDSF